MKLQQYDGARKCFDLVLQVDVSHHEALKYHAHASSALKDYEAAIDGFSRILVVTPNDVDTLLHRATQFEKLQDVTAALQDYDSALRINPKHENALRARGLLHAQLQHHALALRDFDSLLRIRHNDVQLLYNRACLYEHMGRVDNAKDDYDKAIVLCQRALVAGIAEIDSSCHRTLVDSLYNSGLLLAAANDHDTALARFSLALDVALELTPPAEPKYVGELYYSRGRSKAEVSV